MTIQNAMEIQKLTKYKLSKISGIPYATVSDICTGKAQLQKCTAETIYKLSKALDVTMETLLAPCFIQRPNFELFKSNVCHRLKSLGDIDFVIEVLEQDDISLYAQRKWYPECFYLLAMLDYISNLHDVPLCTKYNSLRSCKLQETLYPASVLLSASVSKSNAIKEMTKIEGIPEFMQFNIVENEVRNVI